MFDLVVIFLLVTLEDSWVAEAASAVSRELVSGSESRVGAAEEAMVSAEVVCVLLKSIFSGDFLQPAVKITAVRATAYRAAALWKRIALSEFIIGDSSSYLFVITVIINDMEENRY